MDYKTFKQKSKEAQKESSALSKAKKDKLSRVCHKCKNLHKNCTFVIKEVKQKQGKIHKLDSPCYISWCTKTDIKA